MSILIIAEAGVNHNGSIKIAKQLIDVAVDVGAADHDVLTITNAAVGTRIQVINAAGGDAEKWHAYVASMSTVDATIS